jgi:hypothetical protein
MFQLTDDLDRMPSRYHYMINLLDTLRAFGGVATSQEVYEWFRTQQVVRLSDLKVQESKETRFAKEVRFARQLLFYGGYIAENVPGRWELTPDGWNAQLDLESARRLARRSEWKVRPSRRSEAATGAIIEAEGRPAGPTKGPSPTAWRGTVERENSGPASTYIMRFGDSQVWKIGYASNVTKRLAELNRHIPFEVLKVRWQLAHEKRWPSVQEAFDMEQSVLRVLSASRTTGERVQCSEILLLRGWEEAASERTASVVSVEGADSTP